MVQSCDCPLYIDVQITKDDVLNKNVRFLYRNMVAKLLEVHIIETLLLDFKSALATTPRKLWWLHLAISLQRIPFALEMEGGDRRWKMR